jgi:hypothetical protein
VIPRRPGVLEGVSLVESIGDFDQRGLFPLAENLAVIAADQGQVAVGTPLPPMVDRIGLAVDHMD